jgi:hypothetical protein
MRSSILCGRRQNFQQSTGIDIMTSSPELLYMMCVAPCRDVFWTVEQERMVLLSGKNHKEVLEADLMFYG